MSEAQHPWNAYAPRQFWNKERSAYLREWNARVIGERLAGVTDPHAHALLKLRVAQEGQSEAVGTLRR